MWAICASLGLAPCAEAAPESSSNAANAVAMRVIIGVLPARAGIGPLHTVLDAGRARRFPVSAQIFEPRDDAVSHALAAPAVEGEGFRQLRTKLRLKVGAQHSAGAVQPRLHRLRLEAIKLGGFFDCHFLEHARHEHNAE